MMNIYKVEHKSESKDNGIDKIAETTTVATKYFADYVAAIEYAKKYGCHRFYGEIQDGYVTCVGDWIKDSYYGDNQVQITISRLELE